MFSCAQTTNILCTGRTEIIHYRRSFPVLPLRWQCPVQMVTALEDKQAFPSQTQRVSLQGWGCQSPCRAGKCPQSAAGEEPPWTPRAAVLGWAAFTISVVLALLSLCQAATFFDLLGLGFPGVLPHSDEGFVSEGCTSECS